MTRSKAASDTMNLLHILFMGLAALSFLGGVGVLLSEIWGLFAGNGWQHIKAVALIKPIFGERPEGDITLLWQAIVWAAYVPLDLFLVGLGWGLSKISDGFEHLS
jgi:hypothetical protein